MRIRYNVPPLYSVLTMVWLVLLGLCGVIYLLIVPLSVSSVTVRLAFNVGKVFFAFVLILVWLYSWYVMVKIVLVYELHAQDNEKSVNQ